MIRPAIIAAALLASGSAAAYDADFCTLYARETTRIAFAELDDVDLATADDKLIAFNLSRSYSRCLLMERTPTLPATPLASDTAWIEMVKRNARDKVGEAMALEAVGTVPASAAPTPAFDPAKIALCNKRFRSFRSSDNTVVPRHYRKRTLCPLL